MGSPKSAMQERGGGKKTMASLQLIPKAQRPADIIDLAQPRLNKQDHIEDYLKQLKEHDYDVVAARIIETVALDCKRWNEFVTSLLTDRDWLAGKGGWTSWTMPDADYFELSESERAEYKRGAYSLFIAVVAPTGTRIYVDPEGYNYARYVAFDLEGLRDPKTREQLAREREQKAARERAEKRANMPNYSRDECISEIRTALKRRSGRLWSVTGNRGTAWGWIDIGILPRERNLPQAEQDQLYAQLRELLGTNNFSIPAGSDYYA